MIEEVPTQSIGLSRRAFLAGAAATAAGVATGVAQVVYGRPVGDKGAAFPRPRVIQVRSESVVEERQVHERFLVDAFECVLTTLTGCVSTREAWSRIVARDDVIGLKFNQCGAEELGTTAAMADVMVRSLVDAGWKREQIVAIEVPDAVVADTGVTRPPEGWMSDEVDFGSGEDQLAAVLDQISALINVPFLKTHNIAGVTGCLKNLSHGLVKHPARFHDNGCSPYVADIVALPQIRGKLKLSVVNALRTVVDQGPEARPGCIHDSGLLLGGFDGVALDTVGLDIINGIRKAKRLRGIGLAAGEAVHLAHAAERGLGCDEFHRIDVVRRLL